MTDQDRLDAIKARRRVAPKMLLEEDADWLIGEVERLRDDLRHMHENVMRLENRVERQDKELVQAVEQLRGQVQELETLVRAHNRLEQAMYDTDSELAWPKDAVQLQRAYEREHDVNLGK